MDTDRFFEDPRLQAEFEAYRNAASEEDRRRIVAEQNETAAAMGDDDRKAYMAAAVKSAHKVIEVGNGLCDEAENAILRDRLGAIPEAVSLAYIARKYFGKSRQWLMQRVNGNKVNGKTARFSQSELDKFRFALDDLGKQLSQTALSIG